MPDCHPTSNETQQLIRDTARRIVERELKPHVEKLEHQTEPPYPTIKRLAAALEDHLEFFVPAAGAIEIACVCAGGLVSCGVSYGHPFYRTLRSSSPHL